MKKRTYFGALAGLWLAAMVMPSGAMGAAGTDLRAVGRKLLKELAPAVVTVRSVLSEPMAGEETKTEVIGTVIDPDGLVLVPLIAVDPTSVLSRLAGGSLPLELLANVQVKDMKILREKEEIPAAVVLRDKDLGVAFVRPLKKPAKPWTAVDLKQAETPGVLDPVIFVVRLGNVANQQAGVISGEIQAIIEKPRTIYMFHGCFGGIGVPAFSENGKVLGVCLLQTKLGAAEEAEAGIYSLNLSHIGALPMILPAAEILEIAAQAPKEAPVPTPTPAATPAPKAGDRPTTK